MKSNSNKFSFQQLTDVLLERMNSLPESWLHRLSDIAADDLIVLKKIWGEIPVQRRVLLMEEMEDMNDSDTLVSFDDVAKFALDDGADQVRAGAIRVLHESNDLKLAQRFIHMMEKDESILVRSTAAIALSKFMEMGELEEIPQKIADLVEYHLTEVLNNKQEDSAVQRKALESLGYSSNSTIDNYIQSAFEKQDSSWVASALKAMGRSGNERWEKKVISKLDDIDEQVIIEAIQACGNLQLSTARVHLIRIIRNADQYSDDIFRTAVWNLTNIGGEGVRELLEILIENAEEDDEIEFFEDAAENLEFSETINGDDIFDFKIPEAKELESLLDLQRKKNRPFNTGKSDGDSSDIDQEDELEEMDYFEEDFSDEEEDDEDGEDDDNDDDDDPCKIIKIRFTAEEMMAQTTYSRLHLTVDGRVQGVGFRYYVLEHANSLDVTGWVRNLYTGEVEILAEGTRSTLEQFLDLVRRGPHGSSVINLNQEWSEHSGEFESFRIINSV